MTKPSLFDHPVSRTLAINLRNALKVAGGVDENTNDPRKLKKVEFQRTTGIARSTLLALSKLEGPYQSNPDLHTLCRIADELHIPVAFLLMGSREWRTLLNAFAQIGSDDFKAAVADQETRKGLQQPAAALNILQKVGVYPLPSPANAGEQDKLEMEALRKKNEAFQRATLVTAAILQTAEFDSMSLRQLTLLAATHANQDKSHFLSSI